MIWEIITLILAIPVGYMIAWFAKDELVDGREWFKVLIGLSILFGIVFYLNNSIEIALSCAFILIVSGISLWKSYDKRWTKKRFGR